MADCGHRNRGCVNFLRKCSERWECLRGEFLSNALSFAQLGIDNSNQFDSGTFRLKLAIQASVVASEGAAADYGYAE